MARVFHADAQYALATRHYQAASDGPNRGALPSVGLAQMQLQTEEVAAAIHTLDTYVQNNRASAVPEASIMLASLRANPRRGVSSAEVTQDKKRARDMFDQIWKILETSEHSESRIAGSTHRLADDMDMYLDIARLWQQDSADKVMRALKEALRISQAKNRPDPRIVNNLAALTHIDGGFNAARLMYEDALRMASTSEDSAVAECSTTILYNLARVYEAQDEVDLAKAAYEKLLQRHPEYADGV
jgi:RNA polymerase-associated protein CTR9